MTAGLRMKLLFALLALLPLSVIGQTNPWAITWPKSPEYEQVFGYRVYVGFSTNGPWEPVLSTTVTNFFPVVYDIVDGSITNILQWGTNVVVVTSTNSSTVVYNSQPRIWAYVTALNPVGESNPSLIGYGAIGQVIHYDLPAPPGMPFISPANAVIQNNIILNFAKPN